MFKLFLKKKLSYRETNYRIRKFFFIDIDKAEIHRENKIIPLTAKEYNILLKLVDNANHIVTIGTLCQTACGEMWQGYETTLMTHIRHLREKIEKILLLLFHC